MYHADICRATADILTGEGYAASAEYPGLVLFTDHNGRSWATGLNGWDYATDSEGASIDALPIDVDADETDPERIAAAIRAAIDATREG